MWLPIFEEPKKRKLINFLKSLVDTNGGVYFPMQETSGSVADAINPALATGRDIVINGDFAADSDWTKGTGWTISGGTATHVGPTAGNLTQGLSTTLLAGKTWEVTFTVLNRSAGTVQGLMTGQAGIVRSTNDTFIETFTNTADSNFALVPSADFAGDIDNVIIKQTSIAASTAFPGSEEITPKDFENVAWVAAGTPTRIDADSFSTTGLSGLILTVLTVGKRYRMNLVGSTTSSDLSVRNGAASVNYSGQLTGSLDETFEFTAQTDGGIYFRHGAAGTTDIDWTLTTITEANPLNGDITGATVGVSAGSKLKKAYTFDAANDFVDIHSAEINSVFDPTKGTLLAFALSDTWAAGIDYMAILGVDANNEVVLTRSATDLILTYGAGGTDESVTIASGSPAGYFMVALTWDVSGNAVKAYYNGVQSGSTQTIAGTWVGNLASTLAVIGASVTTPSNVWSGDIAHWELLTEVLTSTEILKIATLGGTLA